MVVVLLALATSCKDNDDTALPNVPGITLTSVATSSVQWTGVTVSRQGKLFACFPRMEVDTIPYSVSVVNGTQSTPFPN